MKNVPITIVPKIKVTNKNIRAVFIARDWPSLANLELFLVARDDR